MASVNKVIIVGRLGQDPEIKFMQGDNSVANISVATTEVFKDREGQKQERTEWHRIEAWGKLAEIAGDFLYKGCQVYVEGKLKTRSWEDEQGGKRYATSITASKLLSMSPRKGDTNGNFNDNEEIPF